MQDSVGFIYQISIHAPREGGDAIPLRRQRREIEFQSTPPARGATVGALMERERVYFISIHAPPRGGRPLRSTLALISPAISIHAPREGGDGAAAGDHRCHCISIHAPREGGDGRKPVQASARCTFQSTPPARGATSFI